MQRLLRGICYIDEILITGETDKEQRRKVRAVLQRLQNNGIRIRKEKPSFMQESVIYLELFCASANGLSPTIDKLKAIAEAPSPINVQQLLMGMKGRFRLRLEL